jgi:nicotinamidase-related amidase
MTLAKQALLVMDVQRAVVDRYPDPAYLPRLRQAIGAARAGNVPVIYVVVGFRPGYPEVSPRNKIFSALAQRKPTAIDEATRVHPDVAPEPGDIVVTKRRVSCPRFAKPPTWTSASPS